MGEGGRPWGREWERDRPVKQAEQSAGVEEENARAGQRPSWSNRKLKLLIRETAEDACRCNSCGKHYEYRCTASACCPEEGARRVKRRRVDGGMVGMVDHTCSSYCRAGYHGFQPEKNQ